MERRRTHLLASLPLDKFHEEVSRGLQMLEHHIAELERSARVLVREGRPRGLAAVRAIATEEAGKYLILVDAVRCGRSDTEVLQKHLQKAHNHIAKWIYAEMTDMSPADFAEVLRILKWMRASHYLDGPNDVDWIFTNELETNRERSLYVDYVDGEGETFWVEPNMSDDMRFVDRAPTAVELVVSMAAAGLSSPRGLSVVAKLWNGVIPVPETHWQEMRALNLQTLRGLEKAGLPRPSYKDRNARRVADSWGFPLHQARLDREKVSKEELRRRQAAWSPEY